MVRPLAFPFLSTLFVVLMVGTDCRGFEIKEATIDGIQQAFKEGSLTSRQLVEYYLDRIRALNPLLHAVIEVNPDAVRQADRADQERRSGCHPGGGLHGIPVLLKDNIATRDRLNTTAGSFALLGSVVPRDAGVVRRLRRAGAVILGKASLSEWAHFRSFDARSGWCARGGQGRNPYVLSADPCGSSSGSAIAAAANMAAVTLGTETDGSIICPAASNSVAGIKPTVGLTSRAGVIPISPRQDTIGPLCRSVSDAVHVLEAIAGYDPRDEEATLAASKYIPQGGYKQFLKAEGLKGKRLGILRASFFEFSKGSVRRKTFEEHFNTMREKGAILIDNLEITNSSIILDQQSGEEVALLAEFKLSLNAYLSELSYSPVRSLADVITFNNEHSAEEKMEEFGQLVFLAAQNTSGIGPAERSAIAKMTQLSREGLERLMIEKQLDAIVTPDARISSVLAIGGYPGISVPAGYELDGTPFGICFGGLKGSEPNLIEIAYAFEQTTKVRKPPSYKPGKGH
ncbi:probable amidase At4g34880 [Phoenix dactylifera]|uniref:Probable amidase At4g34880 n=1 Tax=Phoenix dactylifera TaxID=42345 RepID=A0A8B8ZRA3_PHODC|nr:probable amidase At4g34880 [Phoenix dactylifera]XP_038976776.1 probable amidase At4g34880 [Phoenix dactylifera]